MTLSNVTDIAQALPDIRQDLELLRGPVVKGLGSTWRIRDPSRNRFFDIGKFEFIALSEWVPGINLPQLAERVSAGLDEIVSEEQLLPFLKFLQQNELLSPKNAQVRKFLRERKTQSKPNLWKWLLHNYLFIRLPLINPESLLQKLLPRVQWIYSKPALVAMICLAILDLYLINQHWSDLIHHFDFSFTFDGLLLIALAGAVSKVVHELGHAITARRYGVRVPAMGVAFVVMYPMLYTDTSDSWRLRDKNQRLAIASAGMVAEISVALIATFLWAFTPDGVVRSALFSLAFVGWLIALVLNASPFFRFDGYYILSDAVDMPNLHDRGTELARMRIRKALFGIIDPDPEPYLSIRARNLLTIFSISTHLYRFIVFIGIAIFIYFYFFKFLGILLMIVELGWFVVRPIYSEVVALKSRKSELRPNWISLAFLVAFGFVLFWIWIMATSVRSPAIMTAKNEFYIQAPFASYLTGLKAVNGQQVEKGEEIIVLLSPEAVLKLNTAEISRNALFEELQRTAANSLSRERTNALQSQLAGAEGSARISLRESDLLRLKAPGAGVVRDVLPNTATGRWIRSRELLMRVVSENQATIHAYVDESSIYQLRIGAKATFYPDDPNRQPVLGRVIAIDTAAMKAVPSALLASKHGGPIPTDSGANGEELFYEARYRIEIEPDDVTQITRVTRGAVFIEGDSFTTLLLFQQRMLMALIREFRF